MKRPIQIFAIFAIAFLLSAPTLSPSAAEAAAAREVVAAATQPAAAPSPA